MGADYMGMRQARQERHRAWYELNVAKLKELGLEPSSTASDETNFMYRYPNKPKVNFFPHTGRWVICATNRVMSGGASAFASWYRKQGDNDEAIDQK